MSKFEKIFFALCLSLALAFEAGNIIAKDLDIEVAVNGDYIDFDEETGIPFAENNRTLVPLRVTMEELNVKVEWNQELYRAELKKGFDNVIVPVGENYIIVNDKHVTIDSEAVVYEERIYLPIRSVCEAFGFSVEWDEASHVVEITMIEDEEIPQGLYDSNATITASDLRVRTAPAIIGSNIVKDYYLQKGDRVLILSKRGVWYKISDGDNIYYINDGSAYGMNYVDVDKNADIEIEEIIKVLPNEEDLANAGITSSSFKRNWIYGITGAGQWDDVIVEVSSKYNVDPILIKMIVANESNGNLNTIGAGTYYGLMQVGKGWFNKVEPAVTSDQILSDAYVAIDTGIQVLIKHDHGGSIADTMTGYGGGSKYLSYGFPEVYQALSGKSIYEAKIFVE